MIPIMIMANPMYKATYEGRIRMKNTKKNPKVINERPKTAILMDLPRVSIMVILP